jgi:hypothetical protein
MHVLVFFLLHAIIHSIYKAIALADLDLCQIWIMSNNFVAIYETHMIRYIYYI